MLTYKLEMTIERDFCFIFTYFLVFWILPSLDSFVYGLVFL